MAQSAALCPCGTVWTLQKFGRRELCSRASAKSSKPIFSGAFVHWLKSRGFRTCRTASAENAATWERFEDKTQEFSPKDAESREINGALWSPSLHAEEKDERKWEFVSLHQKREKSVGSSSGPVGSTPGREKSAESIQGIKKFAKRQLLVNEAATKGQSESEETVASLGPAESVVQAASRKQEGAQELDGDNTAKSYAAGATSIEAERRSEGVADAARSSLQGILAGLEQNSRPSGGVPKEVQEPPTRERVQIASANKVEEFRRESVVASGTKWEEEMPKVESWKAERSDAPSADPQEFVRELSELDGLPRVDLSPQSRRKARTVSAQRVVRTVRFLQGLSESQEKKLQKFQLTSSLLRSQERAVWGGDSSVSSEQGRVKAWFGDAELAELLTPLVGRLSTLELNKVLKALSQAGNWKMAVGLLKWMEAQPQCQPDEWSYSTVLALLGKKKRSRVAISVFERMEWRGFRPNEYIYSAMISVYASVREYKDAVKTFGKMVAAGIEPNVITWSALIDACAKGGAGLATCLKLFERMEASCGKELDEHVYNILADAYAKLGDWESVQSVIRTMQEKGVQASVVTLNTLLDGMARGNAPLPSFFSVYRSMLRAGVKADGFSYSILVKACGLRGDMSALDWVYQEMHSNPEWAHSSDLDRVRVYETVLGVYAKQGLVSDALRVFQEIKRQGFEPERVTYNLLITALGQEGQLTEAEKILSVMAKSGVAPNVYSYIALMEAFVKAGELLKVEEVFQRTEEPTVTSFNLLMESYVQRGKVKEAGLLPTEMRKQGLYPNATSYGILICARASGATSSESDAFLGPFRVVEVFDEMKEREANGSLFPEARANVIRALALCGRLDEALQLLDEAVSSQGGESVDVAAVGGSVVATCIERGDVQRLARAVGTAVQGGWKLEARTMGPLLKILDEKASEGGVESVLEALRNMGEGSLGKAVFDAVVSQSGGEGITGTNGAVSDSNALLGSQSVDSKEANGRGRETDYALGGVEAQTGSLGDFGRWIAESPLPSTAELERLFGGNGSDGEEEKRLLGDDLLPNRRLRKSLVDVQWPQRRRVRFGVVAESGKLQQRPNSQNGSVLEHTDKMEKVGGQAGVDKGENGNSSEGGKASPLVNKGPETILSGSAPSAGTLDTFESLDSLPGSLGAQRSDWSSSDREEAPLERLLKWLKEELSNDEVQQLRASLVRLAARSRAFAGTLKGRRYS